MLARLLLTLLVVVPLGLAGAVFAVDNLDLQIERVAGAGWSAENISVRVDLPQRTQAHAVVARLQLPGQKEPLRDVRIDCLDLELDRQTIACHRAQIAAATTPLGKQQIIGRIVYRRPTGAIDLELQDVRIGSGKAVVRASLTDENWDVRAELHGVAIASLLQVSQALGIALPAFTATGSISGKLSARGADALRSGTAKLSIAALTANNPAGSIATEKLSLTIDADVERIASLAADRNVTGQNFNGERAAWRWQARIASSSGQAYAEPLFLDFAAHGIDARARGRYSDEGSLSLESFAIEHQQVLSASGTGRLDFAAEQPLRDLNLDVTALRFPGAYESYLQPLLLDTNFKSLTTSGKLAGHISVANGVPQKFDLQLEAIDVDDGARNLVLKGLRGEWHWLDDKRVDDKAAATDDIEKQTTLQVANSRLEWTGGVLLNLDLGAAAIQFSTRGRQFRLLQPARLPLLDGAIELESFRVRNAGEPTVAFIVDATIQPISVQRLSKAFGWPEFGGSIGGVISKLRMRDGVITLGTTLHAQVFDGEVTISDLRLEQPFGKWPRFASTIGLENLDLELVTRAFSFGRITGRLSGAIAGLQLFNWQPVAFDANLHTPAGDRSAHRISQRAVENIGSIGGGGAGITQALSSGFLRFFDDFNYDRIGISCRLQNEVCSMDGVEPAPHGGYYLVKGKGLPRIDVIGGAHRVDWPRLVQQLIAVTESEGPVVR
jgi:hypothetical protein